MEAWLAGYQLLKGRGHGPTGLLHQPHLIHTNTNDINVLTDTPSANQLLKAELALLQEFLVGHFAQELQAGFLMSLLQPAPQRTGCCLNFSLLNPKPDVSPRDSRSLEGWNLLPSQGHMDHSSVCSLGTDSLSGSPGRGPHSSLGWGRITWCIYGESFIFPFLSFMSWDDF